MVCARVIEPTSKADTVRVLAETGAPAPAVRTLFALWPARCEQRDYRAMSTFAGMLSAKN